MGKRKSKVVSSHTSMRLLPEVKAVLLTFAKDTGWSEAKVANLLVTAGAEAIAGNTSHAGKARAVVDAAAAAHKINVKADAQKAEANAAARKAAAILKPATPAKVAAKDLKAKA